MACKEFDSRNEIFKEFNSYWPNNIDIYWDVQRIPIDCTLYEQITLRYNSKDTVTLYMLTDRADVITDFASKNGWIFKKKKVYLY